MKKDIHPSYQLIKATCSCGATHELYSAKELHLDTCCDCHSAYKGGKKVDKALGGQAEKFKKRYGNFMGQAAKSA